MIAFLVCEKFTTQYCNIYEGFHVCDVITPKVEIGGHFCKHFQIGTMILYNLDRYGFFCTTKTNKSTEEKHEFLVQSAIVMLRGLYF